MGRPSVGAPGRGGLLTPGGTRIVQISYLCSSVVSGRFTVVRVLMPCCRATVVALSNCMNGITCWVIPIAYAFV